MALLSASLSPNMDIGGGDITVVDESSLLSQSGPVNNGEEHFASSDQISVYVVRDGDSLSQIAKMFNVSVNTIIWGNDLSGSTIRTGQTLAILPISGVKYTVKKGDTIKSVAKEFKGDLQEILDYNNLTEKTTLVVGEVIVIPDGEVTHIVSSSPRVAKGVPSGSTKAASLSYYMKPMAKYIKTQDIHGYNAVDMAAPVGTSVVASASGTVVISRDSGWNGGYGHYIVIKHSNGTQTLYAHLSETIVYSGASVVQGQVIGYSGSTGNSTGPHLHFEIRGAANPF